jgi:hypothetical protein
MINEMGGLYFKVIGIERNTVKIGIMNTVYNMRRFFFLPRINGTVNLKIGELKPKMG